MAGSFSVDIARFAAKTEKQIKTVIQKITMEAFRGVIEKTPVDKGHLLGNWSPSIGTPTTTAYPDRIDKDGSATIGAAQKVVFDWNCIGSIFLCNNLPYAGAIEYGHSKVKAPAGMVRVTLAEVSAHYGAK
jgi:hypothetical protein